MSEFVVVGKVTNADWVKLYGTFQKIYRKEDGVNPVDVAKNMLQGLERRGTVEAIGNIRCVTGYSIAIKDEYTGLVGIFQIDGDTHTWKGGQYTMTLSLNFDEIMDEKSYRAKKESSKGKNNTTITIW